EEFVFQHFCRPISSYEGYNFINTLAYGAIMLFVAFFVFYPVLNRRGVKFDFKFALSTLAFVLFGSTFRILEDLKIFGRSCNPLDWSFYTITPGVYILVGLTAFFAALFSLWVSKKTKTEHFKIFGAIGLLLAAPFVVFSFSRFVSLQYFLFIIFLTVALVLISTFIVKKIRKELAESKLNILAVSAHALDGTATFVATQLLSCGEQHPVSNAILGFFPFGFVIVKIAIAFLILHYIDKEVKDQNMKNFLKTVIMILGFAPGIRDTFTVGVGTCN
ncbi:MAG: DUF63 family protein, partial [Candidatus Diapherotrites archaeon]|nr:DUF63 family protein [Candidatus Diapherotrites archaeon]